MTKEKERYGKCGYCGKEINVNNLICYYDSYYCSKKCGILCLLEKKQDISQLIFDLIRSLKE